MIEMIKSIGDSFDLISDTQGVEQILEYIESLKCRKAIPFQIICLGINKTFEIEVSDNIDQILIDRDRVKIYMDNEELEYFAYRLREVQTKKCFYPAEVFEKYYRNELITLYYKII